MSTRRYRVTVDGETYEVEVEELAGAEPAFVTEARPVAASSGVPASPPRVAVGQPLAVPQGRSPAGTGGPAPARSPAGGAATTAARAPRQEQAGGGEVVRAPLPGIILRVSVAPGQAVKHGQVIVVLEAMKMENEIVSPRDGTIREVLVGQGVSVAVGDPLVTLD